MLFQFVMAHDTSRIIQCLLKFGTAEQKAAIFEEVQGKSKIHNYIENLLF